MMQRMSLYQKIADELSSQFPESWERCQVVVEIDEDLATFQLHCIVASEEVFLGLTEELDDCFRELWNGSKTNERGQWKICTYVLTPDGNFTTDFDYDSKLSWED